MERLNLKLKNDILLFLKKEEKKEYRDFLIDQKILNKFSQKISYINDYFLILYENTISIIEILIKNILIDNKFKTNKNIDIIKESKKINKEKIMNLELNNIVKNKNLLNKIYEIREMIKIEGNIVGLYNNEKINILDIFKNFNNFFEQFKGNDIISKFYTNKDKDIHKDLNKIIKKTILFNNKRDIEKRDIEKCREIIKYIISKIYFIYD